jgi:hypothetical protein
MFAGALLNDGTVLLEDGMEVEGVYWESDDRLIIVVQSLKVFTLKIDTKYNGENTSKNSSLLKLTYSSLSQPSQTKPNLTKPDVA